VTLERLREKGFSYLVVGPFAIVLAFPFYWMLTTSIKTNGDLYDPNHVPFKYTSVRGDPEGSSPTFKHISFIFHHTKYVDWLMNTLLVGGLVVLITLVLALPAGYALARLSGRWGQSVGVGIFLTYLVPPTLLFLPLSRVISQLGLQDRLWSLVLVYPSFTVPFATWLLMGFFKTIRSSWRTRRSSTAARDCARSGGSSSRSRCPGS
jgi:multiple sugar transport system permease protein